MDFGAVLQVNPPLAEVIEQAIIAENNGFNHLWTFDSHILWMETYTLYPLILNHTSTITLGPMVTNPGTRDPSVIASMHATLEMTFGKRTICGIGRGDSALRVVGKKPGTLQELEEAITVIKTLVQGKNYGDTSIPWVQDLDLPIWVAAYGPKALELTGKVADGLIIQLADPIIVSWMIQQVRSSAEKYGRNPADIAICVAAPAYIGDDYPHMLDQCRWFGGMVGNHVADLIKRYGHLADHSGIPSELTDYIAARTRYDYAHHGKAGNPSTAFVPDEIVDRFCLLGTPTEHKKKIVELKALGVQQIACYLQHDNITGTMLAYGEEIIPEFA